MQCAYHPASDKRYDEHDDFGHFDDHDIGKGLNVHRSAMAPTPRVENFDEMGSQRHKPVYAPRFPFPAASDAANLDPKVVSPINKCDHKLSLRLDFNH